MEMDIATWHDIADDAKPNRSLAADGLVEWVVTAYDERLYAEVDHLLWNQGHRAVVSRERRCQLFVAFQGALSSESARHYAGESQRVHR